METLTVHPKSWANTPGIITDIAIYCGASTIVTQRRVGETPKVVWRVVSDASS